MARTDKCLIISANGFVGSHLVDELAEQGYKVRAFDRYSRPPQFRASGDVEIFKADFFDDQRLIKALDSVDYVFHLFSATTPFSSDSDPYADINQNLLRSVQFLEMAVHAKVKKLIFMSSGGAVYGHIAEEHAVEETDAPNPVSPYGIAKLATENYLAYFRRKYGLDYVAYRLTNPYGPGQLAQHNQGVIPAFLQKIRNGEELTVYGDGTSSRDFIYVRDATKMIVNSFDKQMKYVTYNIGSGQQENLNTIIRTLEELMEIKLRVHYEPAPKTFLQKTLVSIDRYNEEFGIVNRTDLESGLRSMITP